jgi:hypothetical protein
MNGWIDGHDPERYHCYGRDTRFLRHRSRVNVGAAMIIVTIYLKGPWASPGRHSGADWDRGIVRSRNTGGTFVLQDNDYGLNTRSYPLENIARIEETGHW